MLSQIQPRTKAAAGAKPVAARATLARHAMTWPLSGGGTLAWLMATRVPETTGAVTIAANLDIEDWARIHDYSPLEGSLNPALAPALLPAVDQQHCVGGRDANAPPSVVRSRRSSVTIGSPSAVRLGAVFHA